MGDLPPLAELGPDDLDMARIPIILAASLAARPGTALYDAYLRGDLAGLFSLSEWDDEGFAWGWVGEEAVARIHYGMLWRDRPLDLVSNPPLPPDYDEPQ